MNELNKLIEQAFNAHSDCYADTWSQDDWDKVDKA